jgi:hypothetical protein
MPSGAAGALASAHEQGRTNILGGAVIRELRRPGYFGTAARFVRPRDMRGSVWISADPHSYAARIAELGFDGTQLHQVGRSQRAFIDAFGRDVLPALRC